MDRLKEWIAPLCWLALVLAMGVNLVRSDSPMDFWVKLVGQVFILMLCVGISNMGEDKPSPEELARKRHVERHNPLFIKGKP